jgi:hypothetical protein
VRASTTSSAGEDEAEDDDRENGGITMSGRGNFFARVVQYVVNELIVDRLANKYENESSCFLFVYVSVSLSLCLCV